MLFSSLCYFSWDISVSLLDEYPGHLLASLPVIPALGPQEEDWVV